MTRLLIADDEPAPLAQLAEALAATWPEARLVAQARHGADAWDQWLAHEPEVCFLDIRMPGLTGIDVAQRIAGRSEVVFVTAYGDHALQAFEAGAVDYLVKPLDAARLAQTVARLRQRLQRPAAPAGQALQQLLAQLAHQQPRPAWPDTLQAGVGKEVRLIRVEDVVYFEADSRYTRVVYLEDGRQRDALLRTPLKDLLAQLDPARFQQVHRATVVASARIASALRDDDGGMQLRLRGVPDVLAVSRPFQGLFKPQ